MNGQRVGYVRVSSEDQNIDRQLDGVQLDKVFSEKVSGKDTNRPKLLELIQYVRQGDAVYIHSMDRLARNLDDLRRLVRQLVDKGVSVHFSKEGLTFDDQANAMSQLLLSVMGAFAEFERSLIRERQREGIAQAKKKGIYKGRKPAFTESVITEIREREAKGEKIAEIARAFNVSRRTIYKYLDKGAIDE